MDCSSVACYITTDQEMVEQALNLNQTNQNYYYIASGAGIIKYQQMNVAGKSWPAPYKRQSKVISEQQVYECEVCGKVFPRRKEYNKHVKNVNHTRGQLKCVDCMLTFETEEDKVHHLENEHKDIVCDMCGDVMKSHLLKAHMKSQHGIGARRYHCTFEGCDRKFDKRVRLRAHENTHLGLTPYPCRKCGKGFASQRNMAAHEKVCQLNAEERLKQVCDICGQSFLSRGTLWQHKRTTHMGYRLICDECGAVFICRKSLNNHIGKTGHQTCVEYRIADSDILEETTPKKSMLPSGPLKAPAGHKYFCKECGAMFQYRTSLLRHFKKTNHSNGLSQHTDNSLVKHMEEAVVTEAVAEPEFNQKLEIDKIVFAAMHYEGD